MSKTGEWCDVIRGRAMSHTCGDIDGKPCEWIDKHSNDGGCPGNEGGRSRRYDDHACVPMLALVEARAEVERMNVELANTDLERAVQENAASNLRAEVSRLRKIEKASQAWWRNTMGEVEHAAFCINRGLGPDGKEVE